MSGLINKKVSSLSNLNKNSCDKRAIFRVLRKFYVLHKDGTQKSMELLVMDFDGTRMQVSVKSWLIPYFERFIKLGDWVWAERFNVSESPKKFPLASHPFKIVFQFETAVGSILDCSFPVSVYNFRSFSHVKESTYDEGYPLFDVIGRVVSYDEVGVQGQDIDKRTVDITLEDEKMNRMHCVLGAPYMSEFLAFKAGFVEDEYPLCMIVQLCRAVVLPSCEIGVTDSVSATKLLLDQDDCAIVRFRNKLPVWFMKSSSPSKVSMEETEDVAPVCGKRKKADD